jgi:hypothetical protein
MPPRGMWNPQRQWREFLAQAHAAARHGELGTTVSMSAQMELPDAPQLLAPAIL